MTGGVAAQNQPQSMNPGNLTPRQLQAQRIAPVVVPSPAPATAPGAVVGRDSILNGPASYGTYPAPAFVGPPVPQDFELQGMNFFGVNKTPAATTPAPARVTPKPAQPSTGGTSETASIPGGSEFECAEM